MAAVRPKPPRWRRYARTRTAPVSELENLVGAVGFEPTKDAGFKPAAYASSATLPGKWRRTEESNPEVLPSPGFQDQLPTV